jgi:hypothetical protein
MPGEIAESCHVDRANLFDENACGLTFDLLISGRKDAGLALRDVGATRTTDRGRSSSACTTTPNRSPCRS